MLNAFLTRLLVVGACLGLLGLSLGRGAETTPRDGGKTDPVKSLRIVTGRQKDEGFILAGRDAFQQLLVVGETSLGQVRDLTREVSYHVVPDGIVSLDSTGLVTPLKEGKAVLEARSPDGLQARTNVTVTHLVNDLPISFANQVVPIFTKFGCNSGGCHGKADGQNGFKLSLLGFEPGEDYEYLVKEGRGRRLYPALPEQSLLLRKATGGVAHGGGKLLPVDSPYYRLLRRWIEQGAPEGGANDPTVTRIEILPRERLLDRAGQQQLVVIAHYSDGTTNDVTRMAQFESNQTDLAEVSDTGLVTTKGRAGTASVMARFQAHVDVFRGTVPLGIEVTALPPAKTFIDELVFQRLKELGLPPSPVSDDATYLRRATIDLAGRLPTREEVEVFLASKEEDKRDRLIDQLLASPDYADYFTNKWSAVLRNRRRSDTDQPEPTFAFHKWIRESIEKNKPYDEFVRAILTATGEEVKNPPVIWYREVNDPFVQLEDTAQLFLGQRIGCARCHHHPFEKWSQDDYYGLAAFFSRVEVKDPPPPKKPKKGEPPAKREPFQVSHKPGEAEAVNPRTKQSLKPTGLDGEALNIPKDVDPRQELARWMTAADNPFFARTLVNRYWKHFMGTGLVDPEDDMRVTNPPSNPELLDALAKSFVESKYDMKQLIRTICTSQVYGLSSVPNEHNAHDQQNYSRFLPRRLHAEVLLDAIDAVTLGKTSFKGVPPETRAVQLPDNLFDSYFLSVFGRPDAASACECERSSDASLAQCLHMFNSSEILGKVSGQRARDLARDKRPHDQRIKELYLIAVSREPSAEETKALVSYLEKRGKNEQAAYEDVLWALINTKEFLINH